MVGLDGNAANFIGSRVLRFVDAILTSRPLGTIEENTRHGRSGSLPCKSAIDAFSSTLTLLVAVPSILLHSEASLLYRCQYVSRLVLVRIASGDVRYPKGHSRFPRHRSSVFYSHTSADINRHGLRYKLITRPHTGVPGKYNRTSAAHFCQY